MLSWAASACQSLFFSSGTMAPWCNNSFILNLFCALLFIYSNLLLCNLTENKALVFSYATNRFLFENLLWIFLARETIFSSFSNYFVDLNWFSTEGYAIICRWTLCSTSFFILCQHILNQVEYYCCVGICTSGGWRRRRRRKIKIYIYLFFFWCGTKVTAGGHVMIGHQTKKRKKNLWMGWEGGVHVTKKSETRRKLPRRKKEEKILMRGCSKKWKRILEPNLAWNSFLLRLWINNIHSKIFTCLL